MSKRETLDIILRTILRDGGTKRLLGDMKLLKSTFRAVFRTTAVVAFFMVIRSIARSIQNVIQKTKQLIAENIKLQFTSTQAAAIMASGGKETIKNFEGVIEASRRLSIQTGISANKISEGLLRGALAGLKLNKNILVVKSTLEMATVAGTDFRTSMAGVIGVTRAFGVNTKEISHYADVMTAAFTKANMTFSGFITAMKYVAPIATAAFGSTKDAFIDTTAAIMSLTNAGLDESKAGVYLRGTMLKLMGSTNKVTSAFAKYGVNLYEGKGKAREYMNTMIEGQKVLSVYYDKITRLKRRQYELLLAGKEGSNEYKNVSSQLAAASKKVTELSKGIKFVNQEFRLAGGSLRPFHEIISEINKKIPHAVQVMTQLFGVRGGAGIARLLSDPKYGKMVEQLDKIWKESEKGKSILRDIFIRVLNTAGLKIMRIKNSLWSIFSVIVQSGLKAVAPLLDVILSGVKKLYNIIDSNRGVFAKMFKDVVNSYIPEIKKFFSTDLVNLAKKINVFSPKWQAPLYESTLNKETGKWEAKPTKTLTGETPGDRLFALARSLSSYMIASFLSIIRNHKNDFVNIGRWIGLGVKSAISYLVPKFVELGMWIGKGALNYLVKEMPILKRFTTSGRGEASIEARLKEQYEYKRMKDLASRGLLTGTEMLKFSSMTPYSEARVKNLKEQLKIYNSSKPMGEYYTTTEGIYKKYKPLEKELGVDMNLNGSNRTVEKQIKKIAPALYNSAHILDDKTVVTFERVNGTLMKIYNYMEMVNGKLKKVGEMRETVSKR